MNINRPQTQTELQDAPSVRVTARPTGDRAAVARVPQSGAMQLAAALTSVEPKLQGYLKELEGQHAEQEEQRAYDTIQGMTYEQSAQMVKSGAMRDTESPWFQAAFNKQFGMAHAARRKREIVDAYNNEFDKESGDLEAFLAQYAKTDFEAYGNNNFIMSGYREGLKGVFGNIKDQHAEFVSGNTRERTADQFFDVARGAIDTAVEAGFDPMARVRQLYTDHSKALGLTYGEMDDYVMQIAAEYAEAGDLATVEALMNHNAVGDDGTKVGSFSSRAKYSEKAAQLVETAKANQGDFLRETNTEAFVDLQVSATAGLLTEADKVRLVTMKDSDQITQAQHEAILKANALGIERSRAAAFTRNREAEILNQGMDMITTGNAHAIRDVTFTDTSGKSHTISADTIREKNTLALMDQFAAQDVPTPVMAAHLASYGVDVNYPEWEQGMTNGITALSASLATAGANGETKVPERALKGYAIYKSLGEQPHLRERHINDSTASSIYRDAAALERVGWDAEEALMASASIDRKGPGTTLVSAKDLRNFRNAVKEQLRTGGALGLGSSFVSNGTHVAQWIEESVRIQVDLGVPMRSAIQNGIKYYEESHTVINGTAVNTRNVFLPPTFEEDFQEVLEDFAEATGEDIDDLTLVPAHDDSNYWHISYKASAIPVVTAPGVPSIVHLSQIKQIGDERREMQAAIIQQEAAVAIAARAEDRAIQERHRQGFLEWQGLTRKERKERGLPTSWLGAQRHFSSKSDERKAAKRRAEEKAVAEREAQQAEMIEAMIDAGVIQSPENPDTK